jgi:iron complex outermembrane recepter protein
MWGKYMRITELALLAGTALWAMPAAAQVAPADASADEGEIIVVGRGETQQVQEISNKDLAILLPGTSALKAIEKLPSVNVQNADAFGAYEWAQRVSIRGFNQQQLGYNLDGIPLGDFSYGNVNGLHISRAISSENIGTTRVTQGAGALNTQATNNLGGTLEFISRDPKSEFGIVASGTYGSDETLRGFASVDSGDLGGVRGFLSYAYYTTDKWKGFGKQRAHNVNAKVVADIGEGKLTGFFSFSDRAEQDYQDLSLEQIRRLGFNNDNISNNFPLAVLIADVANNIDLRNNTTGALGGDGLSDITGNAPTNPAAGTAFPAPYTNIDDVYFDASGLRRDYLGSLGYATPLGENLTFAVKGYYHSNHGQGTWWTPYVPTPGGAPISVRTTEYDIRRGGVFGTITGEFGINKLRVSGWYEKNDFLQARRFYGLPSRTASTRSARSFQSNPFFTQWEFNHDTSTLQYSIDDVIDLGALKISAGWKGFSVVNRATPVIKGGFAEGRIKVTDWFQPSVGATYTFGDAEVYANFSQATRAFTTATTGGPFATTQIGFDTIRSTLRPEASDTYEAGVRYGDNKLSATMGVFLVNFRNRIIATRVGAGIVGNPSVLQNVGRVRSYGFEAAADYKLGYGVTLFASYSYNDSKYRNDVALPTGTILTGGKTTVDTPKHLLKGEIGYDQYGIFGRIGANYISRRFFTFTNDQSVPGRVIVDASLGYRFSGGFLDKWEIQANATNLFDKDYVSTIGSNGFGNSGDNQTLLSGAPQQFFITLKTAF